MASRKKTTAQHKRYEKLLSDPKHKPRKAKDVRRHDKLINLAILAGLIYGGTYLIPQKDKEEFAELMGELPGELSAVAPRATSETPTASLTSVLSSFMPALTSPGPAAPAPPAQVTAPSPQPPAAEAPRSGFVGRAFSIADFPGAEDNWQRTEFLSAEAAAQALRQMDRFLADSPPVAMAPADALRDRKAVIYDDGANLRFLIMVEIALPPAPQQVTEPAPAVMVDMPSALSQPRLERSVGDAPAPPLSQGLIARARIEDEPSTDARAVELAGITFINHAIGQELVDLRAALPGNRAIYVRGRAPLTVVADFLSRADFSGIGLDS